MCAPVYKTVKEEGERERERERERRLSNFFPLYDAFRILLKQMLMRGKTKSKLGEMAMLVL
jgi:hypothetical protein